MPGKFYQVRPGGVTAESFRTLKGIFFNSFWPMYVYRRFLRRGRWVDCERGPTRVHKGDWIVTGPQGKRTICSYDNLDAICSGAVVSL